MGLPKPIYEVGFRNYRNSHLYTVADTHFKSVTSILNIIGGDKTNALMIWARRAALSMTKEEIVKALNNGEAITETNLDEILKKADRQPDKLKDEAADLGTLVHNAIDDYILGKTPKVAPEARLGFDNFMAWMRKSGVSIIAGDTPVASVRWGFGGRLDAIGKIGDDFVILDWKTSNKLRDTNALQVAAYAQAFSETYGVPLPDKGCVVRFGKTDPGDFEAKWVDMTQASHAWCFALSLYKSMKEELWVTE